MGDLSVSACFRMFPQMKSKDMSDLLGTSNYSEGQTIPAERVARYNGPCSQALSVFYANNNPKTFIPMLGESQQISVMRSANIQPQQVSKINHTEDVNRMSMAATTSIQPQSIPMNVSIFDLQKKRKYMM